MTFLTAQGRVEVICGPMFSGKTEELIRRVRRAQIARQKIQIFKPQVDTRYDERKVVSHSDQIIESEPVADSLTLLMNVKDSTRIVAIDEVQFFDEQISLVVSKLATRGIRVICAGLDLDYQGRPFGPIPLLLALADEVVKVHAICTICGAPATRSQRLNPDKKQQFHLGETDEYQARCLAHFEPPHQDQMENSQSLPLKCEVENFIKNQDSPQ